VSPDPRSVSLGFRVLSRFEAGVLGALGKRLAPAASPTLKYRIRLVKVRRLNPPVADEDTGDCL